MLDGPTNIISFRRPQGARRWPLEPDGVTPLRLTDEQHAAVSAIEAFIAKPNGASFVVHGPSGSGLSRVWSYVEQSHRFERHVVPVIAGAVAARAAEERSLARLLHGDRPELRGGVVLLDDAAVARIAEVAALRRRGARIVAFVDPDMPAPVHGTDPAFSKPAFTLTERHPTALAHPIGTQARAIRAGGDYHDDGVAVRVKDSLCREDLLQADIVLCRSDETRQRLNRCVREARGFIKPGLFDPTVDYPRQHERIVFLWSRTEVGRGELATLDEPLLPGRSDAVIMLNDHNGGLLETGGVRFVGRQDHLRARDIKAEIDYGYVLPVTEIAAGRWSHVLLVDDMPLGHCERPGWLYAALSAAETSITIIRKNQDRKR